MALCASFSFKQWKPLLVLITAFTIGHSLTLAFSVLDIISIKQSVIEILIPATIITTCLVSLFLRAKQNANYKLTYALALLFGFVHGMGFSYLLKSLLGKEDSIFVPLLSFNIGLEIGQLCIVLIMLFLSVFLIRFTKLKTTVWNMMVTSVVLLMATFLFIQRLTHI